MFPTMKCSSQNLMTIKRLSLKVEHFNAVCESLRDEKVELEECRKRFAANSGAACI